MTPSIARFLKDFGEPEPVISSLNDSASMQDSISDFGDFGQGIEQLVEEPVDIEQIKSDAFEAGRQAAIDEMTKQFTEEKLEILEVHAVNLANLRKEFADQTVPMLKQRLQECVDTVTLAMSEQLTEVISPLLTEALTLKAVKSLGELVRDAMFNNSTVKLVINGPVVMFEQLKQELELIDGTYQFTETDDIDLTVEIDGSVLVTRMSAWVSSLRKVMK